MAKRPPTSSVARKPTTSAERLAEAFRTSTPESALPTDPAELHAHDVAARRATLPPAQRMAEQSGQVPDHAHLPGTSLTPQQVSQLRENGHDVATPTREGKGSSALLAEQHAARRPQTSATRRWSVADHTTAVLAQSGLDYRAPDVARREAVLREAAHADPHGDPRAIARRVIEARPDVFGAGPEKWLRPDLSYW